MTEEINNIIDEEIPGDAEAQYQLARRYYRGDGVEKDLAKAVKLYTMAAEQGHAAAQFNLGNCYYKGEGTEKDLYMARELFQQASNNGFGNLALDQLDYVDYDIQSMEFRERERKREEGFQEAIRAGDPKAVFSIAMEYERKKEYQKALDALEGEKAQEDAECLRLYGRVCQFGLDDAARAIPYYTKSAAKGDEYAQLYLGRCYLKGQGVGQDYGKAVKYFEQSAEQGSIGGLEELAECYLNGYGVKQDPEKAIELCDRAIGINERLTSDAYYTKKKAEELIKKQKEKAKEAQQKEEQRRIDHEAYVRQQRNPAVEILGMVAAVAFYFLGKLFLAIGAGRYGVPKTIKLGFLSGILVTAICIGGLVILAAAALACLEYSFVEGGVLFGLLGGVAGLIFMIMVGAEPVYLQYARYGVIGVCVLLVLGIIRKQIKKY